MLPGDRLLNTLTDGRGIRLLIIWRDGQQLTIKEGTPNAVA